MCSRTPGRLTRTRAVASSSTVEPAVAGDTFGRHVDFLGMPRERAVVRQLRHQVARDGSGGNGQMRWNLISRNGQDVASGVYLFAIDSDLGRQVGRFVIIR